MSPVDQGPQAARSGDDNPVGPSRRTSLAAERTWLAWWRTGIAVATASIAVGGVVPHLVDGSRTPYVVLGVGYALLALVVFVLAFVRHRDFERALNSGENVSSGYAWMVSLTAGGGVMAIATLAVVLFGS
jgi:putative membrane protein